MSGRWDYDATGRPERIGHLGVPPRWFESKAAWLALLIGVLAGAAGIWWTWAK